MSYAKGLIPREIINEILLTGVLTDHFKASKLVNVLDTQLEVSNDPDKYLINICHVLIAQHHQPLTDIGNTILQQLGQSSNIIFIRFIILTRSTAITSPPYIHIPSPLSDTSDRETGKDIHIN